MALRAVPGRTPSRSVQNAYCSVVPRASSLLLRVKKLTCLPWSGTTPRAGTRRPARATTDACRGSRPSHQVERARSAKMRSAANGPCRSPLPLGAVLKEPVESEKRRKSAVSTIRTQMFVPETTIERRQPAQIANWRLATRLLGP